MATLFRWLMRLVVGLVLLGLLAAGLAWYLAARSLPDYDRTFTLEGPQAPIKILRDRNAIPHILATDDADAFFGLGFVHAQDRLWQMTLMRRTAQGRLSELFGPETLEIDRTMRALDLYALAQAGVAHQTPETRAALDAYSAGVNAWLGVASAEALGRGAPEFFLFDNLIAPWTPTDSLAVQKLMALQLTDKAARETLRARLLLAVPQERARDLTPDANVGLSLPDFGEAPAPIPRSPTRHAGLRHPLDPIAPAGMAGASNAFAASGSRSAGGAPLLATDPHLALTAPAIWMLARMDLASGPVIGGTIPGIPAVLIGRSDRLGWGLTASYLDDQDVYVERLNPEDEGEYLTPDGFARFATREVVIGVRGEEPEIATLRWSRHGPVLPGDAFGASSVTPPGHVATLAWTALTEEDRSVGAAIALMRAGDVQEARAAIRDYVAPSLVVTLADRESIAQQTAGAAPARDPGSTSRGLVPSAGWLAVNDWKGTRPYDSNPWILNPPGGVVAHTNNRLTDAPFPDHLSFDWGDGHRILRAERLLSARRIHTRESFIGIQTDTVSEAARTLLPLIGRDLWFAGDAAPEGTPERRRQVVLERLAAWNGEMSEHQPEPLVYAAWIRALQRRLILDELGSLAQELRAPDPVFLERVYRNVDGAGAWCDLVQTSAVETCADMARLALDDALVELEEAYGPSIEGWRWGDAHQALHRHQTLGAIPGLAPFVNIRQSTPGGDHTLRRGQMSGTGAEPYLNRHASGLRAVYDFADPDSSVFIIATGESGHPLSPFYDDQSGPWRRAEYLPMALDPSLARAGAVGVTRLLPAGAAPGS
jgi:penicillin amidase